jgi:N utilization substance protein A
LTGWKIDLYSSREWLEKGGEDASSRRRRGGGARRPARDIAGIDPAVVAVLEEAATAR